MTVIGLCGGSGSGKSTVLTILAAHNIFPINTDEIYHSITNSPSECLDELRAEFGEEVINQNGSLNRKRLAEIVFNDKDKLARLNTITHYHVLSTVMELIAQAESGGFSAVAVDVPLLFESGFDKECNVIVAVIADEAIRIERIVMRDSISREDAKRRISSQLSNEYLESHASYVIINNGTEKELIASVQDILKKIIK